ncbi:uncharacterized protein LOC116287432 [Actinia tenebrosa]|uniref:Uncharacterized protein LOC116287432 n=1 Tax=Actinia tenebrosa TaxID=6105 RepID=A0A6P8H2Y9_ACTTE|nr:uncharacterized protein LOC116287432 [Actinia tenebrosa]
MMAAKLAKREEGFYKRLHSFSTADEWSEKQLKARKKLKTQGVYKVEEILAVRQKKDSEREFLIKWDSWGSEYNSWEIESHILDKSVIETFEKPNPEPKTVLAHVELIRNAIDGGLTDSLQSDTTIIFNHAVFRHIFGGRGKVCSKETYALSAQDFPRRYFPLGWDMTYRRRGTVRKITYPIQLHPFLSRSRQMYNKDGSKKERRWIQKITISFRKHNM